MENFEYGNDWNSPIFWFSKNIGDIVGSSSLALGLNLDAYDQRLSFFRSSGTFVVVGDFFSVRRFGEQLESQFGRFLTNSQTDWDYYQTYLEQNHDS